MIGPHDLGGRKGFGPVPREANEPVFHAPWEARVFGMVVAVSFWRRWTIDASRHSRESLPGYLPMTYYERWYNGLKSIVERSGLANDKPAGPPMRADAVSPGQPRTTPSRTPDRPGRFAVGQSVRTRVIEGPGHTRLPGYAQARTGVIAALRGGHVLPDDSAKGLPAKVQPLYSVRFAARDLFGQAASARDAVYLDLWDSYLEPA